MKFSGLLVALAPLMLAFSEGRAAIGWDLRQCEEHFGKPIGGPFEGRHGDSHNYHFRSKPWDIWANFSDATDRMIMITYITTDKHVLEKNQPALLQENAPGVTKWIPNTEVSDQPNADGLYRLISSGAAGQGSYTSIIEHDGAGNYSLTVTYDGPIRGKAESGNKTTQPTPEAQDQEFMAQVTNIMTDEIATYAVGTAKNNGNRIISAMGITVSFYGDGGKLLDTTTTYAEGRANGIRPGGTVTWKAHTTQHEPVRKVEAVVTDVQ